MKKLFVYLSIIFTCLVVFAAPKEQDRAILEGNQRNLLSNPGFEARKSNWTITGSGAFAINSGSPAAGKFTAQVNFSASGEFFRSELVPLPVGLHNRSCSLVFDYSFPGGTLGHIKAKVNDGTSDLASVDLDPSTDYRQSPPLMFTCPSSGSIRVELESTADAAQINLDSFEMGKLKVQNISQATHYITGRFEPASLCAWAWTGAITSYSDPTADSDCSSPTYSGANAGKGVDPANDLPTFTINNVEKGNYLIYFNSGGSWEGTAAAQVSPQCRLYEATTGTEIDSSVIYQSTTLDGIHFQFTGNLTLTATTNLDLRLQCAETSANGIRLDQDWNAAGRVTGMNLQIYRFPTQSVEGVTLETTGWHLRTMITADPDGNIPLGTANNAGFGALGSAQAGIQQMNINANDSWYKGIPAPRIACQTTNPATGDNCSAGNEYTGISFENPFVSDQYVCVEFSHRKDMTSGIDQLFRLGRASDTDSNTIIDAGAVRESQESTTTDDSTQPIKLCEIFQNVPVGTVNYILYEKSINMSGATLNVVRGGQQDSDDGVTFTVFPLTQQMPQPVFTDLQNSLNSKVQWGGTAPDPQDRVCMASVTCSGSSAIIEQAGDCVASIGNVSAGACTVTMTDDVQTWTGCTVGRRGASNPNEWLTGGNYVAASDSFQTDCDVDGGADCASYDATFICHYK